MANKGDSRLGKGLGALLGEYLEEVEASEGADREVPVRAIRANPYQPRADFGDPAIEALAESIRQNGLLQPLVVRPADGGWQLVAGERRWRAVRRLGWSRVPVIVRELHDEQMLVLALVENLQREDLSPLEEAMGYQRLVEEFDLTQHEVAERVGKDRSTVSNILRLLALPDEVRGLLAAGRLTAGHARAILGLEEDADRIALAGQVVEEGLSVRDTERRVRDMRDAGAADARRRSAEPAGGAARAADPAVRRAERLLERALGTQVSLRARAEGASGEIAIVYHDLDDFERLLRLILGEAATELFDER